jgi:hypothetical protein
MPSVTIADALRYFFAPFAIFFFLNIVEPDIAERVQNKFQILGTVSALVAGSSLYFLYRYFVYDGIVLWVRDCFQKMNYRIFIAQRFGLPRYRRSSTQTALRAFSLVGDDRLSQPARVVRASGIHLLYQTGLYALGFAGYALFYKGRWETISLALIAVLFLWAAFGLDARFEDEELLLLQDKIDKLDEAAKKLGLGAPKIAA